MDAFSYKIQILRGLAIMGVVLIHNTPVGIEQVIYRPFINYSVGLFLFLSGLLTSYQTLDFKKRLKKVLVPYVIWALIYVVATNIRTPHMIMERLLESLVFASAAAMLYYIFVYLELNLCVKLFYRIGKSKYKLWVFIIPIIEILLCRTLPMLGIYTIEPIWGRLLSISCLPWIAYFYFGYLLGNKYIDIKTIGGGKTLSALILFTLLQFAEGYLYYLNGVMNCGTQLKLSAIASGLIICIYAFRFLHSDCYLYKFSSLLKLLGDNSFGVFFCHIAIMMALNRLPGYKSIAIYPLNGVISLLISLLFTLLVKKLFKSYAKYLGA